ncbi:hypothetical protein GUJ93_ZPchr0004g39679 [Zizania palustris]|uniref:Uncharacterized protein n=1 Tax=Zizania palustris TaxID=103762 RepID=A0A8J5VYY0_ZIZPA|nr:hypothetical protein GUJ93_ZPchr0004g39679 [Zizania palustris]
MRPEVVSSLGGDSEPHVLGLGPRNRRGLRAPRVVWRPKAPASRALTGGRRGIPKGGNARSRPRPITHKALQSRS